MRRIRGGVDNAVDHKWSHKMRGEFLGVDLEREIPIRELDPLAW